ncbi:MAG: hypothetical protein PHU75_03540 [Candidatus Nanopelagicales bacterium]|nr:hypothetical protein [Candidatus Nanopelagicales bacterium]
MSRVKSRRDGSAATRTQRNQLRRRIAFVVLTVLPLIVGLLWFSFANSNFEQIQGYNTQVLLLRDTETNRDVLTSGLSAAGEGFVADGGQPMLAALNNLDPGYAEALGKITTAHAPGMAELGVSLKNYTTIATKAVNAAIAPGDNSAAVRAITSSAAYKEADDEFGLSIAAAKLGSSTAAKRGEDNWKILLVVELAITLFITILIGTFSLMTERAIGRADASERARRADRNNLDTEPFMQIAATMTDGLMLIGKDNRIVTANPAAQTLLGMRAMTNAVFEIPADGQTEIRTATGETGTATLTSSQGQAAGQAVAIVTVRVNA